MKYLSTSEISDYHSNNVVHEVLLIKRVENRFFDDFLYTVVLRIIRGKWSFKIVLSFVITIVKVKIGYFNKIMPLLLNPADKWD